LSSSAAAAVVVVVFLYFFLFLFDCSVITSAHQTITKCTTLKWIINTAVCCEMFSYCHNLFILSCRFINPPDRVSRTPLWRKRCTANGQDNHWVIFIVL
jgi:hypothetical protein